MTLFAITDRYKVRRLCEASNPSSAKIGIAREFGSHLGPFAIEPPTEKEADSVLLGDVIPFEPVAEPIVGAIYRQLRDKDNKDFKIKYGSQVPAPEAKAPKLVEKRKGRTLTVKDRK